MYDLGIIGGMGSEATVELYRRIVERTVHHCDQENINMVILNKAIIPDRTEYILHKKENPLPYLEEAVDELKRIGVRYFIIPCNTAHYFEKELQKLNLPMISMIEETLKKIHQRKESLKICILATRGTILSGVYHHHELSKGLDFYHLTEKEQNQIMKVIIDTKEDQNKEDILSLLIKTMKEIKEKECLFVLACTELSLYKKDVEKEFHVLDAMDCLVESSILKCGYKIKENS